MHAPELGRKPERSDRETSREASGKEQVRPALPPLPLEELLQILKQELAGYRTLLDLLQEAQGLILACRAEALGFQVKRQEALQAELAALDRQRAHLVDALGERLGLPPPERTTAGLAAHLVPPYGDRMRAMAAELCPLLERVHRINRDNRFHLDLSRAYLEYSLGVIAAARAPRAPRLYSRKGFVQGYGQKAATVSVNRQA